MVVCALSSLNRFHSTLDVIGKRAQHVLYGLRFPHILAYGNLQLMVFSSEIYVQLNVRVI